MLTMWAAGVAAGAAAVVAWRVAGKGFTWLATGVALAISLAGVLAGGGPWAAVGAAILVPTLVVGGKWRLAAAGLGAASVALTVSAASIGPLFLALSGALALGGITDEMLLGHWYLVDPRLPRLPLYRLALIGSAGVAGDAILLLLSGVTSSGDALAIWVFVVTSLFTLLLMAGVWFSLREPSYPGVMAATGLSYLAVLTVLAATSVGRLAAASDVALDVAGRIVRP